MGLPNPKKAFVEWPPAAVRGFFWPYAREDWRFDGNDVDLPYGEGSLTCNEGLRMAHHRQRAQDVTSK